jgi:hypothetical protein
VGSGSESTASGCIFDPEKPAALWLEYGRGGSSTLTHFANHKFQAKIQRRFERSHALLMGPIDMRKLHMSFEDPAHIVNKSPKLSRVLGPYPHARRFGDLVLTDPIWGGLSGWRSLEGPPPGSDFSLLDTQQ